LQRLSSTVFCLVSLLAIARGGDSGRNVCAARTMHPPRIDGYLNDSCWSLAWPASDFLQQDPDEGKPASERTEVRVLYDDEAIYCGCMFFDHEPEKIVARLTRRDDEIESDWGSIRVDAFHDHQTCFEFTFNPAGVKTDILEFDDGDNEDNSWDPVWEVETRITSDGWSAEVRIPFRVLRYRAIGGAIGGDSAGQQWGINFLRTISRKQESDRWAFTPKSQNGFISRFGHLTGLRDLPQPLRVELLPFVVGRQEWSPATDVQDRRARMQGNAGVDVKVGLSNNFTIDATVNPDFGQVEADPAVLNLSTYETFYPEKRPFFIEGTHILHFTTFGGDFGPGMFYSRRIGRALSPDEVDVPQGGRIVTMASNTQILGAAKLTGKTNAGLSLGVLQAVTNRAEAMVVDAAGVRSIQEIEPMAHYAVVRLKQDVLDGSSVGAIVTSVAKQKRHPAFTGGTDWNLRLADNTYQADGFLAVSHTTADDGRRISGSAGRIHYGKVAATHWLWSLSADFTSNNYDVNDVGFFMRPKDFGGFGTLTYKEDVPAAVVRSYRVEATLHERCIFDGVNIERQAQLHGSALFTNYWEASGSVEGDVGLYDDRETRGNGLYRKPRSYAASAAMQTDERSPLCVELNGGFEWDARQKRAVSAAIGVTVKPVSWMNWRLETTYKRVRNQESWVENVFAAEGVRSIFADRSTHEYDMTVRSTVTFTRELTLQAYAQLLLAKGKYENFRRLEGTGDFLGYPYGGAADFNERPFTANVVMRWEYLSGSTLFVVWSQARTGRSGDYATTLGKDAADSFRAPPANVILVKATYWWGP
jgi:hypothetical protein